MSPVRPRLGFGRRFGYFMLAATAVWFGLVGAIVVTYGWEELQGIGYFIGLLALVALIGALALWN
jgi:Na+/H+-dicarboxylate symporter